MFFVRKVIAMKEKENKKAVYMCRFIKQDVKKEEEKKDTER